MRGMYTSLVANIFFPLHERLKQHTTVKVKKSMEQSQWMTIEQIKQLQLVRLQSLLSYADKNVPYYKQLFKKQDFDVEIQSLDDLKKLPFLTKREIRENLENLKSSGATDLMCFNTGGSSGEPLVFFIGNERVSHDVAAKWRATRWWDVDIGDTEVVVWGSPIELGSQDRVRAMRDKLLRTILLPAFEMSKEKLDMFITQIQNFKPSMLFGYPSALAHIAKHARAKGIAMNDLGIKVAFVTSERLYDEQRENIESVFGCKVANGYGGRDAGFIAHECPEGGMHITAEDIIVEIVDQAGEVLPFGQVGEIVITHLATKDFPFIRYRTGDIAVLDEKNCKCGRGLPLIKEIQGRSTDFIIAADGTVMHGLSLIYVIRDIQGVENFKITQESICLTRVELVVSSGFSETNVAVIRNGISQRLGEDVKVDVELVENIASEVSGKFRYVISHVVSS